MADAASEVDEALRPLREAGLVVSPWGETSRFHIRRPASVAGNRRIDYNRQLHGFRDGEIVVLDTVDAPMSVLQQSPVGDAWSFYAWEYSPGPGPGDFERVYGSLCEAVSAILEYYFGDPAWMCAEWEAYRLTRRCSGPGHAGAL